MDVVIRPFERRDLAPYLKYFYDSPAGYLESIFIDPARMPTRAGMIERLEGFLENSVPPEQMKSGLAMIEADGQTVGFHSLMPLVYGDFGVFHAHIWTPSMRRSGIGRQSYPRAGLYFMDLFALKKLVYRTPAANPGPNRLKQALGLTPIGTAVSKDMGILKDGVPLTVYEATREQLQAMLPA